MTCQAVCQVPGPPTSSRGGLEGSALKESPGGRCGNKQGPPSAPRAPEEMSTGCLESPQGDPAPGDAWRAPRAPGTDCGGRRVRGRHSYRQPASPQPLPGHSESGSPPPSPRPRTNQRRATHCGRACPPTPAPPPPSRARLPPPAPRAPALACR